jgi:methylphosphotriester-DNA--protein-cysteine methyltransferase
MILYPGARRAVILVALALAVAAEAGCSVSTGIDVDARAGLRCVDDSPECISRRQTTLRHLENDQGRAWVKEPATPEAYASGVRLFAFKKKKSELSCDELAHGRHEAEAARATLKSAGSTLTASQVARGTLLASEVAKELQAEMGRRCKKG